MRMEYSEAPLTNGGDMTSVANTAGVPGGCFHPESVCSTESHLANQIRHEVLEYIKRNHTSAEQFCRLTGWSREYTDSIFDSERWDLMFAIRLADHLHINLNLVVHSPRVVASQHDRRIQQ